MKWRLTLIHFISQLKKLNDNKFSILSLNIQSLNSKYDSLSIFLSQLYDKNLKFKAICLQETWLSADYDTSIFNIPGYHMIHHGKKCSQHSCLVIYLSDEFSFTIKDIEIDSDLWDGQFVEVNGGNLNGKLTLGNIYRPPRFNNSNTTLKTFLTELDPIISCIIKDKADVLITGDFNIDLLQINERTEIQKYFDLFVTRGLFPRSTLPTRMVATNASLIDQLFCKVKNPSQHIISCIIKTDISDHFPYFSVLDILKKKNHQPKNV